MKFLFLEELGLNTNDKTCQDGPRVGRFGRIIELLHNIFRS